MAPHILGLDTLEEKDIVSVYLSLHKTKTIAQERIVDFFDTQKNPIADITNYVNKFLYTLCTTLTPNKEELIYKKFDLLLSYFESIGDFAVDKDLFNASRSIIDITSHDVSQAISFTFPKELLSQAYQSPTQADVSHFLALKKKSHRYGLLFFRNLLNLPQRKLPPHIYKHDILSFIEELCFDDVSY